MLRIDSYIWEYNSVGRVLVLQARSPRFESVYFQGKFSFQIKEMKMRFPQVPVV